MSTAAERFSPWNPNNEHRAYYMAHNVIYDMANDYFAEHEKPQYLVKIKYHTPTSAEKAEVSGRTPWFDNPNYYFPKWSTRGQTDTLDAKCERWFHRHCNDMIQGMFNANAWTGIEAAIKNTQNYKQLCEFWDEWFENKRKTFMEKMNAEIMKTAGKPAKIPGSHGGVANLLRVLTKTMIAQGSDIRNIAKMQYGICVQAGIYIPSEFLTDVAVALDYNDQIKEIE